MINKIAMGVTGICVFIGVFSTVLYSHLGKISDWMLDGIEWMLDQLVVLPDSILIWVLISMYAASFAYVTRIFYLDNKRELNELLMKILAAVVIYPLFFLMLFLGRSILDDVVDDSNNDDESEAGADYEYEAEIKPNSAESYNLMNPVYYIFKQRENLIRGNLNREKSRIGLIKEIPPRYDSNQSKNAWNMPLKGGSK